jgi:hypothetical protein
MKMSYKTLTKIAPETTENVVRFALGRYGKDEEWLKNIWGRFSFESIARKYFKEYVDHIDTGIMRKEKIG